MTSTEINSVLLMAQRGESSAQEALFKRYRPYLKLLSQRLAPALLRKRCDASDIVQQTCIDALRSLGAFRGSTEAEFTAWISKILKTNVVNAYRLHTAEMRDFRKEVPLHDPSGTASLKWHSLSHPGSTPSVQALRGEAALALAEAIGQLPEDTAVAVTLRYLEGFKLAEVAKEMEISVGAVAGLVRRGVERLNQLLPNQLA